MEWNDHTAITNRIEIISKDRIRQWDILKCNELIYWEKKFEFPYVLVLTQDCDLDQDYRSSSSEEDKEDKILESILVCPMFHLNDVLLWTHVKIINDEWKTVIKKMVTIWGELKRNLLKNNLDRYYLIKSYSDSWKLIISDLVVDFKFFITIPRTEIYSRYKENYVCSVWELFRENISRRFANYLSRIWLPELREDENIEC